MEAFQLTRYETIPARLRHVSHDAIVDEKLGSIYAVRVAFSQSDSDAGNDDNGIK